MVGPRGRVRLALCLRRRPRDDRGAGIRRRGGRPWRREWATWDVGQAERKVPRLRAEGDWWVSVTTAGLGETADRGCGQWARLDF